jgi:hypothetical protein
MTSWTHSACDACWQEHEPDREPVRIFIPELEVCCYCHKRHVSGIFFREDPALLPCKGNHQGDER